MISVISDDQFRTNSRLWREIRQFCTNISQNFLTPSLTHNYLHTILFFIFFPRSLENVLKLHIASFSLPHKYQYFFLQWPTQVFHQLSIKQERRYVSFRDTHVVICVSIKMRINTRSAGSTLAAIIHIGNTFL